MTESVYQFTRTKLLSHGLGKDYDDDIILSDKKLFSLFVALERARRKLDFDDVYASVIQISEYLESINRLSLIIYAYRYLAFFDETRTKLAVNTIDGEKNTIITFSREMLDTEIAIIMWARMMLRKVENYSYRALNEA